MDQHPGNTPSARAQAAGPLDAGGGQARRYTVARLQDNPLASRDRDPFLRGVRKPQTPTGGDIINWLIMI